MVFQLYKACKLCGHEPILGVKYTSNIYIEGDFKKSFSSEDAFMSRLKFRGKNLVYKFFEKNGIIPKSSWDKNAEFCRQCILTEKYDIFHPTYYDDTYSDVKINAPIVLTIHDMIYESYPQFFWYNSVIKRKKELAERATRIIAISEFTKKEILRYYDSIDESKIHVIHHGIDLSGIDNVGINKCKDNYILYVGERWLYKDFFTLLRSIRFLKLNGVDLKLKVVGRAFSESESNYIDFMELNDKVENLGRVSDEKLKELYLNAMLYVSTSLSEGFGLPLLECMKYGTPMLLSDIPVYREVAGDAAIYFKANDDESLADNIRLVYTDLNLINDLIDKGRERVMFFDIKTTSAKTIDLYKNIL